LVRRLGFPGVEHGVADNSANAVRVAAQIGYPVVIKPIDSSQGRGVTVGVISDEDVIAAFAQAHAFSPGRVVVERFVHGDDHRLAVHGGRLAYALRRSPPRVVGDGKHTVAELINIENESRPDAHVNKGYLKKLKVDDNMLAVLRAQQLSLHDRVVAGRLVTLRGSSNISGGGTFIDVTDLIHPDIRNMSEAIARCFRLDAVGIDFITPDIGRSWQAMPCAVTEVNSSPHIFLDEMAQLILAQKFPDGGTGRVPIVIAVSNDPSSVKEAVLILQRKGLSTGYVERASTSLDGQPRFIQDATLSQRVMALLLDPSCEALVVALTQEEIVKDGLPVDFCHLIVVDERDKIPKALFELLRLCSFQIVEKASIQTAMEHLPVSTARPPTFPES
jgi:cyanophycin synthetase